MLSTSCEPIALALGISVRGLQAFIAESRWSSLPVLTQHERLVAHSLGDTDDGVFLVDESGMPKQGHHSAGVAHQYCGALGKVCSCQVGVFIGYASRKGYTLVSGQLFVPQDWFGEPMAALRLEVGLPTKLTFRTKPQIAVDLLQAIAARGRLLGRWVAADALYGNAPAFRDAVAAVGKWYFTQVSSDQLIWRRTPALLVPAWSGSRRKPTKQRLKRLRMRPIASMSCCGDCRLVCQIGRSLWPYRYAIWHQIVAMGHSIEPGLRFIKHLFVTVVQHNGPAVEQAVRELEELLDHIARLFSFSS